jgi:hypothetical protein
VLPITSVPDSGGRDHLLNVRNSHHTDIAGTDFISFSHFDGLKSNYIFSSIKKVIKFNIFVFFVRHWPYSLLYVCVIPAPFLLSWVSITVFQNSSWRMRLENSELQENKGYNLVFFRYLRNII